MLEPDQVKVVVLGQDPYHGAGQAEGLSFSVAQGPWPPSLKNIFKELCDDLDCQPPFQGSLLPWAEQGVLLLNRVLTVSPGRPDRIRVWLGVDHAGLDPGDGSRRTQGILAVGE